MKGKIEIETIIMALFVMSLLFSCMPEVKKKKIGPEPEGITAPILPADTIDKKISTLEDFLKKQDISNEDRESALALLSDYRKIRSAMQGKMSDQDYREVILTLFNGLDRLDEKYFLEKASVEDRISSMVIDNFALRKQKIRELYLSENYQEVISMCAELEADFGRNSLMPDIGLLFALSLAENNMLAEAIDIGESIVGELEGKPDLIHLRAGIIEWLLGIGEREKAIKIYEKLVDNVNEREALFNIVRQSISVDEEYELESHEEFAIEDLLREVSNLSEPDRAREVLIAVEKLIMENSYSEARLMLLRWRLRIDEGLEEEIMERALEAVTQAEERYQNKVPRKDESIEKAAKLIEEENFKDALEILNSAQEAGPEAKELRDLAIERLINSERNRAAKLFLQIKNTDDPKRKEDILLSSYKILKELIETYPSSDLIDKLKNDLKYVRDELEKLRE